MSLRAGWVVVAAVVTGVACGGGEGDNDDVGDGSSGGETSSSHGSGGTLATGGTAPTGGADAANTGGTSSATARGPLSGTTYCELLASCCAQTDDPSCLALLEVADGDAFRCFGDLRSFVAGLDCGPTVQPGTVSVTYSLGDGPEETLDCAFPGSPSFLLLETIPNAAIVECRTDAGLATSFRLNLPAEEGTFMVSNGLSDLPTVRPSIVVGNDTYLYGNEARTVVISTFNLETGHVVGNASGSWSDGEIAPSGMPAPPLSVTVDFDVYLPLMPTESN